MNFITVLEILFQLSSVYLNDYREWCHCQQENWWRKSSLDLWRFSSVAGINLRDKIPALDQFNKCKIKELWTRTETANRRFMVLRRGCFRNLTDAQIMTLRYVKMVQGSRLYDILIKRQFNEIVPEDCNVDDILTELVIKVLLLALHFVRFYFW